MSEIQANKLSPASGTALQVGDSGDTITIPSGATITNSGTANGFGGAADNYFATSGLSNKDLGVGLHIKNSDTSGSVSASADQLVLEANSDMGMTMLAATSGECFINFGDSGDNDIGQIRYHHSTNHMSFHTNAVERIRLDGSGVVNIGDTSSSYGYIQSNRPGTGEQTHILFVNGSGPVGTIKTNSSSTAYNTSSDYRLKENEVAISDGIERLKQLKPYRFNFKLDKDEEGNVTKTVDGFFAHEVSPVVPEAISGEKDAEEMQGIDQSKLVPLLTSALQEAITKIETLEAKVETLEKA